MSAPQHLASYSKPCRLTCRRGLSALLLGLYLLVGLMPLLGLHHHHHFAAAGPAMAAAQITSDHRTRMHTAAVHHREAASDSMGTDEAVVPSATAGDSGDMTCCKTVKCDCNGHSCQSAPVNGSAPAQVAAVAPAPPLSAPAKLLLYLDSPHRPPITA